MWLETFGTPDTEVIFYVFCGVSGLILILSVLNIILGCCVAKNSAVRVGGSLDFAISVGSIMLCFPVLVPGLRPDWFNMEAVDIVCKIYHVILIIGLTQFIGGLFVKGWTVFLFYKYNSEKAPISEEWIPNLLIWILILIAVAASMVWEFLFMPELVQGQCVYDHEMEWKIGTSAWHGLLLVLALISVPATCSATRRTHGAREANILGIVVVNTVLTVVAGICLYYLFFEDARVTPRPTQDMRYAVMGGLMLWMCLFADFMFVVSKLCHSCNSGSTQHNRDSNYDTIDAGSERNSSYLHANPSYDSTNGGAGKTNDTFEY